MSKRLIWLASSVLVLGLASNGFAAVPAPWDHRDIGAVGAAGGASYTGTGAFTVVGDGGDIWDATDRFHYVYMPLSYDGEIQARVTSLQQTNDWAKAGVMIREQLTDTSSMAMMIATPPGGTNAFSFQWVNGTTRRQNADGGTVGAFPVWVKIVRSGNNFTGYYASDNGGSPGTWVQESTQTIPMAGKVYIGLCLTSHSDGVLCTATFDNVTVLRPQQGMAISPIPADGAMFDGEEVSLTWEPGESAALHDVYFSDNFDAVNTATTSSGGVYKGRQTELKYPPGPYTEPVVRGATYYWRIDEINGLNTWRGDVWSFTVMPEEAWGPTPPDGDTLVPMDPSVLLSWHLGDVPSGYTVRYPLYYSTSKTAVDTGTTPNVVPTTTSQSVGGLPLNTTIYWRVDTRLNYKTPPFPLFKTIKGKTWSFTTAPRGFGSILREIWEGVTPTGSTTVSDLYNWPDFPYSPTTSDLLTSFDSPSHGDNLNDFGGQIHGWVCAPVSGDYTFYIASDDNGELWLSTDENPANAQLIAYEDSWTGDKAWQYGPEMSAPIPLVGGNKYYISALWKEGTGDDHCAVGWTGPGIPTITVIPGRYLMPYVRLWAQNPSPRNNTTMVPKTVALTWTPGIDVVSHEVYFGTNRGALPLVDTKGMGNEEYDPPGDLDHCETYYWKIVEVNLVGVRYDGPIWQFTIEPEPLSGCELGMGWFHRDIGTTGGNAIESDGTWTVRADGADISSTSDEFHYVYKPATGDYQIIAQVQSLVNTHNWAKAGVMIRESLAANSKNVCVILTPRNGSAIAQLQWRSETGGTCNVETTIVRDNVFIPEWVKLVREGNTFTGYHSDNGVSWTEIGSTTVLMPDDVYLGLAVTSHYIGALTTAVIDNVSITARDPNFAYDLNPPKGAVDVQPDANLSWMPGDKAAWHQVYLGTDPTDLELVATKPPGSEIYQHASGFDFGQTYYWRIDEVNGVNIWRGNICSFTVVRNLNWNPSPPHQATDVPVTTDLSWSKGALALVGHIIYVSTDFSAVNNVAPGTMSGPAYLGFTSLPTGTSIVIPGDLLYNTTYYWRADPVEKSPPPALVVHKGEVWEFKTIVDETGSILREIWEGVTPDYSQVLSDLYNWPDFPYNPTTSVLITQFDTEPGLDNYGGRIHGWLCAPVSGDYTFYIATDDNGELWLSAGENPANAQLIAYENSWTGPRSWQTGAEMSAPISLVGGNKYYISALWKEGNGGDNCAVGWTGPGISAITVIPGDVLMPYVVQYRAYDPIPANGATGVSTMPTLDWVAGRHAASHDVYFGTSYANVKAGTGGTFEGNQPLGDTDYVPSPALEAAKVYYWKITEVNNAHPDKKWEGPVWAFRVASGAGGLLGSYYHHTGGASPAGFETFVLSRTDPEINFNWGDPGSPDPSVNVDQFTCRWQGQVEAQFSEDYVFYTSADDGERLWIDGQLVINQWVDGAAPEYASAPIPLVAGQKYDIVMEQYENEGAAAAYLRWSSPSTSKRIIPSIWLWPYTDVRIVPVAVLIDPASTTEVRTTLPDSIEAVVRGSKYYLEIWASDIGATKTGLTGVYVDISFCGQTSASAVEHGTVFTMFTDGDIQPGGVDEFGGSTFSSGAGVEPNWVRVGWIEMSADLDAETCSISLLASTGGVAAYGQGLVPWAFIDLGAVDLQILPPARSYNLDGDSVIGVGDLSLFAPSWQRSVPPAQNAHDFDCDCFVGVGDLSWFATGWMKSPADPTILYPPCPGGRSCGEAALMRGMAPRGFTLTSLRPMAKASSGPADVDVAFELVVLNAPSASGTTTLLPASIGSIAQGQTYYVEVWVSDVGDISTGITSAYVDLHFPAAAASVTNVSHGNLFTLFPSGSVVSGVIDELGGSQLSPGVGVAPQWARVAVIRMRADAVPPSVAFSLSPSSTKVAAYGRGVIDWDEIALGAASVPPKITGFVRTPRAAGLDGVLLSAGNGGGSSLTDATGYYEVVVPQGWSGTVTPGSIEFSLSFDPDALSYSNVMNMFINQDYTAHNICDLDGDDDVTIVDFAYFADYWLQSGAELPANFDLSDPIGYPDLEIFVNNWLWTP